MKTCIPAARQRQHSSVLPLHFIFPKELGTLFLFLFYFYDKFSHAVALVGSFSLFVYARVRASDWPHVCVPPPEGQTPSRVFLQNLREVRLRSPPFARPVAKKLCCSLSIGARKRKRDVDFRIASFNKKTNQEEAPSHCLLHQRSR